MQHLNLCSHVINNEKPATIHHPIQLELQINHGLHKQYLIGNNNKNGDRMKINKMKLDR